MFGAVETDEQFGDPVPDRAGGDALHHQADALRHDKPGIAQHGAHQVIGEHLGPVGAHRDRRPLSGLADEVVGFVGVRCVVVGDGRQCGVKDARACACRWS